VAFAVALVKGGTGVLFVAPSLLIGRHTGLIGLHTEFRDSSKK